MGHPHAAHRYDMGNLSWDMNTWAIYSWWRGGYPVVFSGSTRQLYGSSWTEISVYNKARYQVFLLVDVSAHGLHLNGHYYIKQFAKRFANVKSGSEFQNEHCCLAEECCVCLVLGWFSFVFSPLFLVVSLPFFLCPHKTWKVVGDVLVFQCGSPGAQSHELPVRSLLRNGRHGRGLPTRPGWK